jgi:tetratricopeptide (TPR) repeat protein
MPAGYEDSDLAFRGKDLKGWALGAEGLLADWYWMWSLQYIGGKVLRSTDDEINLEDLRPLNPRLLHPLLDNAAELDPEFMAVYSYGASVLPAIDARLAIELTEKGIARNPDAWRLYQYLGYIYWRMKEYEKAAEVYERGARIAGAPAFMRQMVAAMNTQGGSRDTARGIYSQMLAEAEDQQSRNIAELRLMELDALDELDAVNALLRSTRASTGRCPSGLTEIFPRLRSVKLPHNNDFSVDAANRLVDPTGVPYVLDGANCTVSIAPESKVPKSL